MGASGLVLGAWSALTGIAAQAAAGPYIEFMLGYAPPKAGATAGVFALCAAVGALAAWVPTTGAAVPVAVVLLTAFGATVGVLIASWAAPRMPAVRRLGQGLVVFAAIFVIAEGIRSRLGGPPVLGPSWFRGPAGWLMCGAVCGALAQLLALPLGVFLVPVLVFGVGLPPGEAIIAALAVAALAAILPVLGYVTRDVADREIGPAMHIGGAIGACAGGWVLATTAHPVAAWPLAVFGVTAMVLSSWLAYRAG